MSGRSRFIAVVLFAALCGAPHAARAQEQPSTAPTTAPVGDVQLWLGQLADTDEAIREEARVNLMGLKRDQLPALRRAVEQSLPLAPSQRAALRDIVRHVYLTGESYEAMRESGFLGIFVADARQTNVDPIGLMVVDTMPGFCAFRVLRAGDVIVRISEYPDIAIREVSHLSNAIQRDAGRRIHLEVLRRGKMMRVELTVDPRPAVLSGAMGVNELLNERNAKAEKYWQETFVPLLQSTDAAAAGGAVAAAGMPHDHYRINSSAFSQWSVVSCQLQIADTTDN